MSEYAWSQTTSVVTSHVPESVRTTEALPGLYEDLLVSFDEPGHSARQPTQKNLLKRALDRANSAVTIDKLSKNAASFAIATDVYNDACNFLYEVMILTEGPEDRGKLSTIINTYQNRIQELSDKEALAAELARKTSSSPPSQQVASLRHSYFTEADFNAAATRRAYQTAAETAGHRGDRASTSVQIDEGDEDEALRRDLETFFGGFVDLSDNPQSHDMESTPD